MLVFFNNMITACIVAGEEQVDRELKRRRNGQVYFFVLFSMEKFKPVSNTQYFLLPPSVEDFITEDHLARVISEVIDSLDTSAVEKK